MYRLLRETWPKARKEHRCIWCGENILIGEKYRFEVSIYDGLQVHRWHLECDLERAKHFVEFDGEFSPYENSRGSLC